MGPKILNKQYMYLVSVYQNLKMRILWHLLVRPTIRKCLCRTDDREQNNFLWGNIIRITLYMHCHIT